LIDLGTLGGNFSWACSINDNGQIVGWSYADPSPPGLPAPPGMQPAATLFDPTGNGNNVNLRGLGDVEQGAGTSINARGQIVGYCGGLPMSNRATLFDPTGNGNNIDLGIVGDCYSSEPFSINEDGLIVGASHGIFLLPFRAISRATLFCMNNPNNNINLGTLGGDFSGAYSINNAGQIVGYATTASDCWSDCGHATLFDSTGSGNNTSLGILAGYSRSTAYSINDAGIIVGVSETYFDAPVSALQRATLFDPTGSGSNIDLGTLGGDSSLARSINSSAEIVGYAQDSSGVQRATMFDRSGNGNNIDLNNLIDPALGWELTYATSINDHGWIVGVMSKANYYSHAFLLVPITISPDEQIQEILDFIETSVSEGTLEGVGPGKSADNRLNALINMLESTSDLIVGEYFDDAYAHLVDVLKKCDGQVPAPDFVSGEGREELAQMIMELMEDLVGEE